MIVIKIVNIVLILLFVIFWYGFCESRRMYWPRRIYSYYFQPNGGLNIVAQKIFKENGIVFTNDISKADLYEPSNFDKIYAELTQYKPNCLINGFINCDLIVSKAGLWEIVSSYYGTEKSLELLPKTWNLLKKEPSEILKYLESIEIFIAKKDLQRQTDILLLKLEDINTTLLENLKKEKYVVLQEYLKDPLLISNRKTNIRVYCLIKGSQEAYIFDDGFMYYTKENYEYSTNNDNNITTGYIDREVYKNNPLTIKDLYKYLGRSKAKKVAQGIKNTIKQVMIPCVKVLKGNNASFQLFGIDVQVSNELSVKLIEINKNPSLVSMDLRDSQLKEKLQRQMYSLIGVTKGTFSNFIRII